MNAKSFLTLLLFTNIVILPAVNTNAAQNVNVVEAFATSSCGLITNEEISEDGGYENPDHFVTKFNKKLPATTLNQLVEENPDIIALNYFDKSSVHQHDDEGNDIVIEGLKPEIADFILKRQYVYRRHGSFLNRDHNFQMVVNGQMKIRGEILDVARSTLKYTEKTTDIKKLEISKTGTTLNITLPKITPQKDVQMIVISYITEDKDDHDLEIIQINKNIVQDYKMLDDWDGEAKTITADISDLDGDHYAILAQDMRHATIYAAGKTN